MMKRTTAAVTVLLVAAAPLLMAPTIRNAPPMHNPSVSNRPSDNNIGRPTAASVPKTDPTIRNGGTDRATTAAPAPTRDGFIGSRFDKVSPAPKE